MVRSYSLYAREIGWLKDKHWQSWTSNSRTDDSEAVLYPGCGGTHLRAQHVGDDEGGLECVEGYFELHREYKVS